MRASLPLKNNAAVFGRYNLEFWTDPDVRWMPIEELCQRRRNGPVHSQAQINEIANDIKRSGLRTPVLIDDRGTVIAGASLVEAAKVLGMKGMPVIQQGRKRSGCASVKWVNRDDRR